MSLSNFSVEQSLSSLILPPLPEPAGPHVQAETGVSSHSPLEPSSPSRLCHDSSEAHPSQSTEQEALPEDVEVCNKPIKSSSNLLSRLISCSPKRLPSVVTQHRLFICMDSNRKQLALSSGAFAVVLSAIEALKASGQLRNSSVNLETPLNQANIQESRDVTKTFDNRLNALEGGHLETGDEVSPGMPENGNVKDLMELLSKFLLPNKGPSNGEAFSAPTEPKRICLSTPISTDSSANVRPVLLPTGHRSDDTCHSMGGPTSKSQSFSLVSSSYDQDCEDESISIASGALASSETSLLTSSISTMGNSTSTSMPKTLLPLPSDTASLASVSSVLVKPSGGEEIFDAYSLLERQEKEEREERQAKRQLSISSSSSSKLATAPKTRRLSALADLYGLNEPPPPPMVQQSTQQSSITSHSSCAPSSSISSGGQEFASAVQLTNSLGGYTSAATGSLASNVFFTSPTQHTSQSLQQQSQSHPPSQQQSSLSAFYPPCLLYYQQSMANPLLAAQAATISSTVPSTVITTAATTSSSFLPATSSPQAISTLYPPGLAYFPRMSSQQPLYSSFSVTSEPAPPGVQPN
ncbi:unnamed protein product [Protopolystoma xenopodis]|uniref:Uncharacterized protein n=1 Tax=Protopolystoma xenopodis TaxID=117903 RepID=A0A448WR40_9PLAT|nr:unnamed protein product [Protopolystoma xenopodis]